ncbi:hypothetical protein MXB_5076, partial [Myxobolus squamalis]
MTGEDFSKLLKDTDNVSENENDLGNRLKSLLANYDNINFELRFKSDWIEEFDPYLTKEESFYKNDNNSRQGSDIKILMAQCKKTNIMGARDTFTPFIADFSGISTTQTSLFDIIQCVSIRIDEKGADASAATGAIICSDGPPPRDTI